MTKERTDCRFDVRQLFIRSFLCVSCLPMSRGRHRASFDQVSEFNRGIIIAYRIGKCPSEKSVNVLDKTKQL
ncbi:hypothetical protein TNCV_2468571 [Trichonephila clavipes]|nr:hypothetical protein TNCV_2468571 [Trichonephila clavipes]